MTTLKDNERIANEQLAILDYFLDPPYDSKIEITVTIKNQRLTRTLAPILSPALLLAHLRAYINDVLVEQEEYKVIL